MISEEFRTKFKKDLGDTFEYSPEVLKILAKKKELNRKGKPYSPQSIRNVFSGAAENKVIEIALFMVYKKAMKAKKTLEDLENELNNL